MSDRWTQHNMDKCGVAWWKMDESSGNIIDSKNGYIGTPYNLIYQGKEGIYFNGSNSYIRFSDKIIPIGKKSIYLEVKKDSIPSESNVLLDTGNYSTLYGFTMFINSAGKIRINTCTGVSENFNTVFSDLTSIKNVCDGKWHKVLFTWDGEIGIGNGKLYIDDFTIPDVVANGLKKETNEYSFNLLIGKRSSHITEYPFEGSLRNIQVYYDDVIDPIPKYYFIQTNDNKIWTYNTAWQDTGMVIGDLDYTNVSAKSNFETYGMFADENLSSQALQDLKDMGYTSYRVLIGKM